MIPESAADLLSWEKKAFAHLALVLADGTPQCTPLWADYDGTHIIINSAAGRVKDKAMRRQSQVALAISDPDNPYRYIQIRGKVVEITAITVKIQSNLGVISATGVRTIIHDSRADFGNVL